MPLTYPVSKDTSKMGDNSLVCLQIWEDIIVTFRRLPSNLKRLQAALLFKISAYALQK